MTHDANIANTEVPKGTDPELSVIELNEKDPRFRPTIVVIAGMPRTGKDTFINAFLAHANSDRATVRIHAEMVSSVVHLKEFLANIGGMMPAALEAMFDEGDEPTEAYRACLSDIKYSLDKHFNFTYRMAETIANNSMNGEVIIYQVRETANIRALQYLTNANFLSVHLWREDRPDTPMASSDKDGLTQYDGFKFDYVIKSKLEDMPAFAELLFNRIARIKEGSDTASNLTKRTRGRPRKEEAVVVTT